jgi:hypothetical protein
VPLVGADAGNSAVLGTLGSGNLSLTPAHVTAAVLDVTRYFGY